LKLAYIGDHERDFPGVGTFEQGKVIEVNQETAEMLLASGYFVEQKDKDKVKEFELITVVESKEVDE